MTTFAIFGLNGHEIMPLERVFKKSVAKTAAITAERPVEEMEHHSPAERHDRQHMAEQAYSSVEKLPYSPSIMLAEQVMTSPVTTLKPEERISEAMRLFQTNVFRHIPVVSSQGRLVGIVSDRDVLRFLAGLTKRYQQQVPPTIDERVEEIMTPQVLTASVDTDVRYIARLFVEQHIGAMPIVKEGELAGIITRSDVLGAVMRHYTLELWA